MWPRSIIPNDQDERIQQLRRKFHGASAVSHLQTARAPDIVRQWLGLILSVFDNGESSLEDDHLQVLRSIGADVSELEVVEGLLQYARQLRGMAWSTALIPVASAA